MYAHCLSCLSAFSEARCKIVKCAAFHKIHAQLLKRGCNTEAREITKHHVQALELPKSDGVVVPKRIPRGPTDILKALATTIGKDDTAAHYKYHDDPYLIPASNISKRSFALSKESGKRAARYFLEKYPDSFINNKADPVVEAFDPPIVYTEESEVSEDTLIQVIKKREVNNSIVVYQLLEKQNVELGKETVQSFLELLCFYNCTNPERDDFTEERWFKQASFRDTRKKWKVGDLAESVFNGMKDRDSSAYCAIIQGMAKYFHIEQAYSLYKDMRERKLIANVETYNSLMLLVPYLREGSENRWALAEELINNMTTDGTEPNIGTMNALLSVITKFGSFWNAKKLALKVTAEMKRLQIEPSLGTYYFLLLIFCRDKGPTSRILEDILNEIENKEFSIVHPNDTFFFVTAMDVAHNHNFDISLAYRLNDLLHLGNNCVLIGDSFKESIYYQQFFRLLCKCEDLEKVMELYYKFVPHVYIPEPSVMKEILSTVEMHDVLHYVPQLWTDITVFGQHQQESILELVLGIIARKQLDKDLQSQFVVIAWSIKEIVDSQDENYMRVRIQWTGQMLGDIMSTFLNGDDFERAWLILKKLNKEQANIIGVPHVSVLKRFCQMTLENKLADYALLCLQYSLEVGHLEVGEFVRNIFEKHGETLDMPDDLRSKISELLPNALKNERNLNGD